MSENSRTKVVRLFKPMEVENFKGILKNTPSEDTTIVF